MTIPIVERFMDALDIKTLRKFLDMDRRARQMVDTAVVYAIGERGYPEEECDFREFASDIATRATAALLKMIYEEDAEISRLRTERDHYKRIAEESLLFTAPKITIASRAASGIPTRRADTIEELTEQNCRVKLVMGGALTMLAGYDADAANELRAALHQEGIAP